jgi:hypothetical protein
MHIPARIVPRCGEHFMEIGRNTPGDDRYDIAKILEKPESWCNNDGLIANKLMQGFPGQQTCLSFISGESHERGF